jgi:tRNA-Thr(GGU) m(6)t(6)A37 methyltransferase TsaA
MRRDATRPGEVEGEAPDRADATLVFVGRIRTPFATRDACPRRGDRVAGPACRIEVDAPWRPALAGLAPGEEVEVLYWMHQARRDLLVQAPRRGTPTGTFALRSPVRPNPIASSVVEIVGLEPGTLVVRGLDCVDGTPLLDLKPARCAFAGGTERGA